VTSTPEQLKEISEYDAQNFKDKHYTNNRVTIVIAGNVQKDAAMKMISKYFPDGKSSSKIDRLQEPPHHGVTTRLVKYSAQINVPVIEIYWKVPNYRNGKKRALAAEIFVHHMNKVLPKLLSEQGIIASISFSYTFWNYDDGDFSITVTPKNAEQVDRCITAVISEIKCVASDGMTKEQVENIVKAMKSSSNMLRRDTLDAVNWIAGKIGSGNEFDFVKKYQEFIDSYDLNDVNAEAKKIFNDDPCVISVIKPARGKD
jgi:zinc protease